MESLESICRSQHTLSDVQIHILKHSEKLLQFASDVSHRNVLVLVPGKRQETLVLAAERTPLLLQQTAAEKDVFGKPGQVLENYDVPVSLQVLATGESMQAEKEVEYGKNEPFYAYPFVDNAGKTIAVIVFLGNVEANRELLTDIAYQALQVPILREEDEKSLYTPLSVQDGVVIINCNGIVIYADEMAESILYMRGHAGSLVGSNIYNSQLDLMGAKRTLASHEGFVEDVQLGQVVFTRRVIPLLRGGKVRRVIVILREKTELYRKEEELMIKTSVIKEIHHRVKNNLQTIASLLRMQMRRTDSDEAKEVLKESLNRILSISLVHETLSHHEEENIDISDIAKKLLDLLTHSLVSADCQVTTEFSGETLPLPSDGATSLALVLNELITNAITHGFEGKHAGHLALSIEKTKRQCTILVRDDGIGMEQKPKDYHKRKHLGLEIVRTLIEKDLKGTITFAKGKPHGTVVTIQFPLLERS